MWETAPVYLDHMLFQVTNIDRHLADWTKRALARCARRILVSRSRTRRTLTIKILSTHSISKKWI